MSTALDSAEVELAPEVAARPRRRRARKRGIDRVPVWQRVFVTIVALYFILPALIVIPMSFSESSTFQFPPKGFTLNLYERFFTISNSTSTIWLGSLGNSFLVALLAAALATILGTAAALALDRLTGRAPRLLRTLMMLPLVAPSIVVAVDVYVTFLRWHLVGTVQGYVLAHAAIALPFVIVSVTAALGSFDRGLLRASASLGASSWRSFITVTAPLISRGIVTGAVFAFVTSFDEVVIALFIRSPQVQTLPVQMYNAVTSEIDPTISAASSIIVVVVTIVFLAPQLLGAKKRRR
jgi:putative spermidine/putrescine transport system permease protein